MLNVKQKEIVDAFINLYGDLGISWIDFVDGAAEIYFRGSICNPFTAREFTPKSYMRGLIESLERKLRRNNEY